MAQMPSINATAFIGSSIHSQSTLTFEDLYSRTRLLHGITLVSCHGSLPFIIISTHANWDSDSVVVWSSDWVSTCQKWQATYLLIIIVVRLGCRIRKQLQSSMAVSTKLGYISEDLLSENQAFATKLYSSIQRSKDLLVRIFQRPIYKNRSFSRILQHWTRRVLFLWKLFYVHRTCLGWKKACSSWSTISNHCVACSDRYGPKTPNWVYFKRKRKDAFLSCEKLFW